MKLRLSSSVLLCALAPLAFANPVSGKYYVGAFGGFGTSTNIQASQFGTAYFVEGEGGPLAVNAFGKLNDRNALFLGLQLGYQTHEISLNSSMPWTLTPAIEFETYTMNSRSFDGTLSNNSARLAEHDFAVSYPVRNSVFLVNAVMNFNSARYAVQPYIGFGIGNAVEVISGATSEQVNPQEFVGNHYNTKSKDIVSTFAGQAKLGLSYDITKCVSVFAEYRWLYLANTHFIFGSTVAPLHVETSSWQVALNAQMYNLGNIGVRYNW